MISKGNQLLMCCSGPGWPALDTLRGKLFLVWTPESFHDYLNLYPNLENALCFVSSVDGNSGDDGGTTVTDPAGVFIQTYDGLSWSSPVTAAEIAAFETRVSLVLTANSSQKVNTRSACCHHCSRHPADLEAWPQKLCTSGLL